MGKDEIQKLEYMPFKKSWIPFIGKTTNTKEDGKGKLQEPIALIIKDNYDIDIYQNVKPGRITVQRDERDVDIIVPKSKILSFPWGGETIRGWIVDVREGVALPQDTLHDSLEFKRTIEAMQTNYKNYTAQTIRAQWDSYIKLIVYVILAIAAIMFIAGMFGMDVVSLLGLEKLTPAAVP